MAHITAELIKSAIKTNSMQESPWESESRAIGQEIPSLLCTQNSHYRVHESRPLTVLSHINQVHTVTYYFLKIRLNISAYISQIAFLSGFPIKNLYACLISPMRVTCYAHLILFWFNRHSNRTFVKGTNYEAPHLFSDAFNLFYFLKTRDQASYPSITTGIFMML
jgi:hypothetical protein